MNALLGDIKYGIRRLSKTPGFTALAVLSLAFAIGANTTVFGLYNAALLKPLPVPQPRRLRVLTWVGDFYPSISYCRTEPLPTGETKVNVLSYPLYKALRDRAGDMAEVFAFSPFDQHSPLTVLVENRAYTAHGLIVSGNFFQGLGLEARIGRTITPEYDRALAEPVAVLSDTAWRRYFDSDVGVVGRSVTLNRHRFTIVGVLAPGFLGPLAGDRSDFYIPMSAQALVRPECALTDNDTWWVQVMARLSTGTSEAQFQTDVSTWFSQTIAARGWAQTGDTSARILVEEGSGGPLGIRHHIGRSLPALLGIVAIVLLAACANLASLLLARGASRQQEVAVRAALGAGSWRLLRQGLTESLLIALAGTAGGLLLATWAARFLSGLLWPSQVIVDLSLDARVLGFTILVCVGSALLFGLLPAWRNCRVNPIVSLKERSSSVSSRMRLGKWLVSIQTALALLLLVGAGLFIRTLVNLYQIEAGFDTRNLLVFSLDVSKASLEDQQKADFHKRVRSSIAGLPGVLDAANSNLPLLDRGRSETTIDLPNRPDRHHILLLHTSDSFLSTMGIPLLSGRDFNETDQAGSTKVILINGTFARTAFPDDDPVGQILNIRGSDYQIVGVCGDMTYYDLKGPLESTVFFPYRQASGYPGRLFYEVRVTSNPMALVPAIRKMLADSNVNVPMGDLKTMAAQLDESIAQERCFALLAIFLAVAAVVLSGIGLFALMAYRTTQRTGEIGVRLALGARPRDVGWSVLRDALYLVLLGVVLGVPLVLVTSRLIRGYLFGIDPCDPLTIAGAAILLTLVSLAAVWLPVRRAAKTDPMEALRYQ